MYVRGGVSRRDLHRTRRQAVRARHVSCRRVAKNDGFTAHRSAAWWRRYWSPAAVARRKRQAAVSARRKRAKARRQAAKQRHYAALGYSSFPNRSNAWWNRYFRKLDTHTVCHTTTLTKGKVRGRHRKQYRPPVKRRPAPGRPATRAARARRSSRSRRAARR